MVSWSSPWCSPDRGPCGIFAAWGPGSPGMGWAGLECRNQWGVAAWCPGAPVHRVVGPGGRGAPPLGRMWAVTSVGSTGRCVAASRACCRLGAAPVGGEWLCVVRVYLFHGGGGALGSGVVWVRGRSAAGSGCRGLTLRGSSPVSPRCVSWGSLVGWLWTVFVACRTLTFMGPGHFIS